MIRRLRNRRAIVSVCFFACVVGLSLGLTCPFGGAAPYNPAVPSENRSPRVVITSLSTPKTPEADRYVAEPGDLVTISFSGEDAEDIAVVRVFASTNANPSPAQEIPIMDGYPVGPGAADGTAVWSTVGVTAGTYYIFAEIDDRTYNPADGSGNPSVRTTSRLPVVVAVPGTSIAQGVVNVADLGFGLAGARFYGFSVGENLGSSFFAAGDLDLDGPEDFMIVGRFASPRGRVQSGAAYLLFGRKKTPFPADTNENGLPDTTDPNGNVVDFPETPAYYTNPYDASNVGRFGGTNSINSVGTFFRGTTYTMPEAHDDQMPPGGNVGDELPPLTTYDALHPAAYTSGLMSVTHVDLSNDGVRDFVFGLPFVSSAWDFIDSDPADGCSDTDLGYLDVGPQWSWCETADTGRDDLVSPFHPPHFFLMGQKFVYNSIGQGIVIAVDGTNNISENGAFSLFVDAGLAGQHDPDGAQDDEGVQWAINAVPAGMRFRGGWFDEIERFLVDDGNYGTWHSESDYGRTIARMPNFDNSPGDELLISSPGYDPLGGFNADGSHAPYDPNDLDRGRLTVWRSGPVDSYLSAGIYASTEMSLPSYTTAGDSCIEFEEDEETVREYCLRAFVPLPNHTTLLGEQVGDRFGFARPAGDFNQDGVVDILAGAPGASRNGRTECGVVYILKTPLGGFGDTDLKTAVRPRIEIIGNHSGDMFGLVQTSVLDINADGVDDVAFASESYDEPNGVNSGYVGVIFGARPITGEEGFSPVDVGTFDLPGVKFYGAHAGAKAGHDIASAGDFNGDGVGDLLITSPGERRQVDVQSIDPNTGLPITVTETHVGVAYLIFGGQHLVDLDPDANVSFNLTQVGTATLPGIVFISRFALGTQDEAPIETAAGIGDIDGDGFDDIILGAPHADFVYPNSPNQRRVDAGEAYIVYGSNYGSNRLNQ